MGKGGVGKGGVRAGFFQGLNIMTTRDEELFSALLVLLIGVPLVTLLLMLTFGG